MSRQNFKKLSDSFLIDSEYEQILERLGLTNIEAVFSFSDGKELKKNNLSGYRSRVQFETASPAKTFFLKRFNKPPVLVQLKNWLDGRGRKSCASFDFEMANKLFAEGINTARPVCFGEQFGLLFEKRSFCITEKIADAESLERKLPDCFHGRQDTAKLRGKRGFIKQLAKFVKKFHETGYRHRDLYFSHIFYNYSGEFYLIDLARAFRPLLFGQRFRIKDLAQLYYSAPGKYFSKTDRLRFFLSLTGKKRLNRNDKSVIKRITNKSRRMAKHDKKHNRAAPFEN